jgi:hypothetical protein
MDHTIGYHLFGIGKLPDDLRASLAGDELLALLEGIRVEERFAGHVPGLYSRGRTFRFSGSLAATSRRVVACLGSWVAFDTRWDADDASPAKAVFSADGLALSVDVSRIDAAWTGELTLRFVHAFTPEDLVRFPRLTLAVPIPPERILQLAGARPKR